MEENKFKEPIQNIGLDDPGTSFTDSVMEMIENQDELRLNQALLFALKSELLTEPSFEFSDSLMANIQTKENKIPAPIRIRRIRLILLVIGIPIFLLVLINSHLNLNSLHNSYFSHLNLSVSDTTMGIIKISNSILPYLIPISILLIIDYIFRTRQGQLTSREQSP